jgi:hypothetical protein
MESKGGGTVETPAKKPKFTRKWICSTCSKQFEHKCSLHRHQKLIHTKKCKLHCPVCGVAFSRFDNLKRHIACHKGGEKHLCHVCNKEFYRKDKYKKHIATCQGQGNPVPIEATTLKHSDGQIKGKLNMFSCL